MEINRRERRERMVEMGQLTVMEVILSKLTMVDVPRFGCNSFISIPWCLRSILIRAVHFILPDYWPLNCMIMSPEELETSVRERCRSGTTPYGNYHTARHQQ